MEGEGGEEEALGLFEGGDEDFVHAGEGGGGEFGQFAFFCGKEVKFGDAEFGSFFEDKFEVGFFGNSLE